MVFFFLLLLLLAFYSLQFSRVDSYCHEKKIDSLDLIVMGVAYIIMAFMSTKIDVKYVDWLYSITWPVSLNSTKAMFIFSIFAIAFKTVQVDKWFGSNSAIKGLCLLCALVISTVVPSPLLVGFLLLFVLGALSLSKIEKLALMSLPFLVVMFEIFSASEGVGLAHLNTLVGETLYQHFGISVLVLLLFLSSVSLLANKKSLKNPTVIISLGIYINLLVSLASHLNENILFANVVLVSLAIWYLLSLRLNAILPLAFNLKKQSFFLMTLYILAALSADTMNETLRLISLFIFMNLVVSEQVSGPSGKSLLRISSHILSLLFVSVVLPINIVQMLLSHTFVSMGWSLLIITLMALLVSLITLRAYSFQKYELKSEHLVDFKELTPAIISFILLILVGAILFSSIEKTNMANWSVVLLAIPSLAIIVASLAGYQEKLDKFCAIAFTSTPLSHETKTLGAFVAGLEIIKGIGRGTQAIMRLSLDGLRALFHCLSYICQVSLDWSLRNKTQFLFVMLAATISVVTGWAL